MGHAAFWKVGSGNGRVFGVTLLSMGASVALALSACSKTPDPPADDPRGTYRAAMLDDPDLCFYDRAEYCIRDPEFVEAVIDDAIERNRGELPDRQRALKRFIFHNVSRYRSAQLETEEARNQVHALMVAHYENAPITINERSGVPMIDLGVVPTGLTRARVGWTMNPESPLLEESQPQSAHVARQLLRLREAHPEASQLDVKATVRQHSFTHVTEVSWYPSLDKISVKRFMDRYVTTTPLGADLAPLIEGSVKLSNLYSCNGEAAATDPRCM